MEFKELIRERRSVRAYAEGTISHEELAEIVKEAQMAPSWKNTQSARTYAVEDPEKVLMFRERALPDYNQRSTEKAAAYFVTTFVKGLSGLSDGKPTEPGEKWGVYDLGLHDAYLVLAARNGGYDTLIMGLRNDAFIREFLAVPEDEEIVSVIAIGKRASEPAFRPRKDLEEVAKFY